MRPLPRLHAITDGRILGLDDLGIRAAAIAAGGPSVALHVRHRGSAGKQLAEMTHRFLTLAEPPEAAVVVNGHPEIARACRAHGVQLRSTDLTPGDARRVMGQGWIGSSVHSFEEARTAVDDGADFLLVGAVFPTPTHPGQPVAGVELVSRCAALGMPVIAIGGMTPDRAREVRDAGAWGVGAISALWDAADPAGATLDMLAPWIAGA
jgi:thiamine-phosphate diphosphorylase